MEPVAAPPAGDAPPPPPAELLRTRSWDRHASKQGHREPPLSDDAAAPAPRAFSFSAVPHAALDRVAGADVQLLSHLGDACAAPASAAGLSGEQASLRERVAELLAEGDAHEAAAAEAARLADAAAARAAELERRLQSDYAGRRAQLQQEQEVRARACAPSEVHALSARRPPRAVP